MMEQIRKRKTARRRGSESGFSMIELMVVIVILGMLATLVAVNVLGNLQTASVNSAKAQISNFKSALMSYRLEYKKFPDSLDALLNNPKGKKFLEGTTSIPKDPWGNDYIYSMPGPNNEPYEIKSLGADGQSGGDGENADIVSWNLQGDS